MATLLTILTFLNTVGVGAWLRDWRGRRKAADVAAWAVEHGRMLYRAAVAAGADPVVWANHVRASIRAEAILFGIPEREVDRAITIAMREFGRLAFEGEAEKLKRTIDESTLLDAPGNAPPDGFQPGQVYRYQIDAHRWERVPPPSPEVP